MRKKRVQRQISRESKSKEQNKWNISGEKLSPIDSVRMFWVSARARVHISSDCFCINTVAIVPSSWKRIETDRRTHSDQNKNKIIAYVGVAGHSFFSPLHSILIPFFFSAHRRDVVVNRLSSPPNMANLLIKTEFLNVWKLMIRIWLFVVRQLCELFVVRIFADARASDTVWFNWLKLADRPTAYSGPTVHARQFIEMTAQSMKIH